MLFVNLHRRGKRLSKPELLKMHFKYDFLILIIRLGKSKSFEKKKNGYIFRIFFNDREARSQQAIHTDDLYFENTSTSFLP